MEEHALLQRPQRVHVGHVGRPAIDQPGDPVDLLLGQLDQRQHRRGDHRGAGRDQVRRHHHAALRGRRRQPGRGRRLEQRPGPAPARPAPAAAPTRAPPAASGRPGRRSCPRRPTRSRPRTSANAPHTISSLTVAGPRPAQHARVLRRGQRRAVELAAGGQRQRVQDHDRRGHHVVGQPLRRVLPRTACARRVPAGGDDVADQPLVAGGVLADGHRGLGHARAGGQHRLDLARLDPEPADLDLLIGPPGEDQLPVRRSTGPGPRSGTSAPRPPRTGTP